MGERSRSMNLTSRRSSGSAKDESPTRSKAKRHQIAVACNACRRRKTKCDGHRPVCSVCVTKDTDCTWSADPDATPMVAIKRKYQNLESEFRDLHDLVQMLMDRPRPEAQSILDHLRKTRDASSTLAFVKDGDLLTWGLNGNPPQPTRPGQCDHDGVHDITAGVNLMNGREDGPGGSPGRESNESMKESSSPPRRRLAISDLVNST